MFEPYRDRLLSIFESAPDKHAAMQQSEPVLEEMSNKPELITEALRRYIETPGTLDKGNYPVVSIEVESNPHFGISANCWIPLADGRTNLSTKAIHHHGDMLLDTVTVFGPGYEHWMFTTPRQIAPGEDGFTMQLLERAPHPLHHVGFVDANIAHVPFYPPSLTITFALWSSQKPATWKDKVKRLPVLKGKEKSLRHAAGKLGLAHALDLKAVEYFDFHPTPAGFAGMRERTEFALGPNADHLHSFFHLVQGTGNAKLAPLIAEQERHGQVKNAGLIRELLEKLKRDIPISGRISQGHFDVPFANFTAEDITEALAAPANRPQAAHA